MSVLNTLLAIDGSPDVLKYLAEMGLTLPSGFRSRHPQFAEVKKVVAGMKGWALRDPDRPNEKKFWCDLYRDGLCVTTLMFSNESAGAPLLGGTRGDLAMPLLKELARELGPLVVLYNAEKPLLVEAPQA